MTDIALNGSLQGLKLLDSNDLHCFKTAVTKGSQMGFAYYFPSILARSFTDHTTMLVEEIDGSICIYRLRQSKNIAKLDLFATPIPLSMEALRLSIERANEYNRNYQARILKIDAKDYRNISGSSLLRFRQRRAQYLYSPRTFSDISGGKFRTLRRNVKKVTRLGNVVTAPYSAKHYSACLDLLHSWRSQHRKKYRSDGSFGSTKRLLDMTSYLTQPDLIGEVISINNRIVAFSFGGEIRPGYGAFLEAKCSPDITGLSFFQRYSFLLRLSELEIVNDGSDLNRQGLAQLKNSLRPIDMHSEYLGMQTQKRTFVDFSTALKQKSLNASITVTGPEFSGPLSGLKQLESRDLSAYQNALQAETHVGWGYYFPYLLTKNRLGRSATLVIEEEGSICLFLWQLRGTAQRLDLLLPPIPLNETSLKLSLERANDFNQDYSARIMRIDTKDKDAISNAGIQVSERKRQYIFSSSNYTNLSGKEFYTVRRNVSLVERLHNVSVTAYSKFQLHECHKLLERWGTLHRERHGTSGGIGTSRRIIDLAGSLPDSALRGQLIYLNDRLVAFAFGGEIRPGLACSFERKCDTEIRGLSYYQLATFLSSFSENTLINDGSDAGSKGLKQLKNSFRPACMHIEYRGSQRRRRH